MLLDPLTCGFAKVYFYEVLVKDSYRLGKNVSQSDTAVCYHEHFNNFIVLFKDGNGFVDFSYEQYKKSALKLKQMFVNIGKSSVYRKNAILTEFSLDAWRKLKLKDKESHSFMSARPAYVTKNLGCHFLSFKLNPNVGKGKQRMRVCISLTNKK